MRKQLWVCALWAQVAVAAPEARQLQQDVLKIDAWGLGGAEMNARARIIGNSGSVRELAFTSRSRKHAPSLSKSLVRFSAPADVAGVGFLQVEKADGDDERSLYLPELKKSRRIAGDLRSKSFMGTDFSYGDMDRRDFREATVSLLGEAPLGKFPCWKLEALPTSKDALYSRMEVWIRKDNAVPLKWEMFDRGGKHVKTLSVQEIKKVGTRWFITRSVMKSLSDNRATELVVQQVTPRDDLPDSDFTVRQLEKT